MTSDKIWQDRAPRIQRRYDKGVAKRSKHQSSKPVGASAHPIPSHEPSEREQPWWAVDRD